MTTNLRILQTRSSFTEELRTKAKKKREQVKVKKPAAKPRVAEASLNEIREAISDLHASVKKGSTGSVKFTVTERDSSGRIKSFTVDHK